MNFNPLNLFKKPKFNTSSELFSESDFLNSQDSLIKRLAQINLDLQNPAINPQIKQVLIDEANNINQTLNSLKEKIPKAADETDIRFDSVNLASPKLTAEEPSQELFVGIGGTENTIKGSNESRYLDLLKECENIFFPNNNQKTKIELAKDFCKVGDYVGASILLREVLEAEKDWVPDNTKIDLGKEASTNLQIFENENEREVKVIEHSLAELDERLLNLKYKSLESPEKQIEQADDLMKKLMSAADLVFKLKEGVDKKFYKEQVGRISTEIDGFINQKRSEINNLKNNNMVNPNQQQQNQPGARQSTGGAPVREAASGSPDTRPQNIKDFAARKEIELGLPAGDLKDCKTADDFKRKLAAFISTTGQGGSGNSAVGVGGNVTGLTGGIHIYPPTEATRTSAPATVAAAPAAPAVSAREALAAQGTRQDRAVEDRGLSKKTWQILGIAGALAVGAIATSLMFGKGSSNTAPATPTAASAKACACAVEGAKKVSTKKVAVKPAQAAVKAAPAGNISISTVDSHNITINNAPKEEIKVTPVVAATTVGVVGTISAAAVAPTQQILTPAQQQVQQPAAEQKPVYNVNITLPSRNNNTGYAQAPAASVAPINYTTPAPTYVAPAPVYTPPTPVARPIIITNPGNPFQPKPIVGTAPSAPITGGVYPKPGVNTAPTVNAPIVGGGNGAAPIINRPIVNSPVSGGGNAGAPNLGNPLVQAPVRNGGNSSAPNLSGGNNSSAAPSLSGPRPGAGTGSGSGAPIIVNNNNGGSPTLGGPKKVG